MSFFAKENLIIAIRYLLYILPLTPAIVAGGFLFPYISARTIYFRSLIEIALFFVLVLWWRYRTRSRVERNYFFIVFSLFVVTNIISSFFSYSFLIAWFSDIERMWGVFTLLHLFLFYFLLRAFFTGREWRIFLNVAVIVSVYIAGYGIIQHYPDVFGIKVFQAGSDRIISTLGNSAYVAIYMLFSACFALFLFLKTKNTWLRFGYGAVICLDLFAFNLAGIRGAILGLLAGITVAALGYILLGKSGKLKFSLAGLIIAGAAVFFFAFLNPNLPFVQSNSILQRISSITLSGGTVETRFVGWNAAWRGFLERPLFGVGMDNFDTVFNKFFDADYYLYAPTEPYFDRAHNAWLDLLVMTGGFGFLIFMGFVFFIFYYLITGYRAQKITLEEFLLFTAMSVAYFVHLIFVFDDLNSYMYFVILFAFIEYRYHRNTLFEVDEERKNMFGGYAATAGIAILVIMTVLYQFNIKVALACTRTIDAVKEQNVEDAVRVFGEALDYDIIPSRNVVLTYINQLAQSIQNIQALRQNPAELALMQKALTRGQEALDREIQKDPVNALLYNRQAVLNNIAALLSQDSLALQNALQANQKSIELSREHLQYYYTLADTYLIAGDTAKALEAVQRSIAINSQYEPGYYQLMRVYLADNQLDQAFNTGKILANMGYTQGTDQLLSRLADMFEQNSETERMRETLALQYKLYPQDGALAARLMREYLRVKDYDSATALAEDIRNTNESLSEQADYLIQEIKAGRGEEVLKQMEEGK
jgi:O-antigen ligase